MKEVVIGVLISGVFTIMGVVVGGLVTGGVTWVTMEREYSLNGWEKILERRITAHESVFIFVDKLRNKVTGAQVNPDGVLICYPESMESLEDFKLLQGNLNEFVKKKQIWLSPDVKKEANFIRDYLISIGAFLMEYDFLPDECLKDIGKVIHEDFSDLATSLEGRAYEFFENEIDDRKLAKLKDSFNYSESEKKKRLLKMRLFTQRSAINEVIASYGDKVKKKS